MQRFILTISLLLSIALTLNSQQLYYVPGEVMVSVQKDEDLFKNLDQFSSKLPTGSDITIDRKVSEVMNIWLLSFDQSVMSNHQLLSYLREESWVKIAQNNHIIQNRITIPNDPLFSEQWHHLNLGGNGGLADADIDSDEAWDIATGGNAYRTQREVVVAVIDDGIELTHPDLAGAAWFNEGEMPGNGIDDDGNGYIDDYRGWNTFTNNDDVTSGFINHGVYVSGMVGAVGNNGTGISGINWNVKIMTIVGGNGSEANALSSYNYAITQRRIFNETDGAEGAFVVATNSSWGVDRRPEDAPLWCAFYDSMGVEGIVSAGATKNFAVDVDVVSDLPTACPSEYLISVTATNNSDERTFSAWGKNTIDLAAPGRRVFTTDVGGGYTSETGTSFATPLVAGTVGLLYAAPCSNLLAVADSDPAEAARMCIRYILEGVDKLPALENELVTGGRLNVANAMRLVVDNCLACPEPTSVAVSIDQLNIAEISWLSPDSVAVNIRYKPINSNTWEEANNASSPFELIVQPCTDYEFQLQPVCPGEQGEFGDTLTFLSAGCCDVPSVVGGSINGMNELIVDWEEIPTSLSYDLRWRNTSRDWTQVNGITENQFNLGTPSDCDLYEFQVRTICPGDTTDFSEIFDFLTPICSDCDTLDYCDVGMIDSDFEWIDSFSFGEALNVSGNNGGYGDFTGVPFVVVDRGMDYPVRIVQEYDFNEFDEWFKVWIDYNMDGIFDDDELVFDSEAGIRVPAEGVISIPDNARRGNTRMRVAMKFVSDNDVDEPTACGGFQGGEIEDYCILILGDDDPCGEVPFIDRVSAMGMNATVSWNMIDTAIAYTVRYRKLGEAEFEEKSTVDTFLTLEMLETCSNYEVSVRTVCPFDTSQYSRAAIIDTDCPNSINEEEIALENTVKVFPNPFTTDFTVEWEQSERASTRITIFDLQGRLLLNRELDDLTSGKHQFFYNRGGELSAGLYFVRVQSGQNIATARIVKSN